MNNDFRKMACYLIAGLVLMATIVAFALWAPPASESDASSAFLRVHDPSYFSLFPQKLRKFLIFAMFGLPLGVFSLCRGFNKRRQALASEQWPTVTGTVLAQKTIGFLLYRAVSCEYVVGGRSYRTGLDFPLDQSDAKRLPPGAPIDLRYDPDDPTAVVHGKGDASLEFLCGILVLAVLPLLLL
jgi:Protein of unknown function (DUF3592)